MALPELLAKLGRPGDYYGFGATELPVVRITVDGVGTLGLPLPKVQAEALRAVARDAPYGRSRLHTKGGRSSSVTATARRRSTSRAQTSASRACGGHAACGS